MDDSTSEHDDRWRLIAERQIRDAIQAGEFDNLAGTGQPLAIEENPFVPEDWRMAFKVLENAGVAPDWIVLAGEIDRDVAVWRRMADEHFATLRARLDAVAAHASGLKRLREEVQNLKAMHQRATARHAVMLDEINRKIRYYNATVPVDSALRLPLNAEAEMRAWADRLPAYLTY